MYHKNNYVVKLRDLGYTKSPDYSAFLFCFHGITNTNESWDFFLDLLSQQASREGKKVLSACIQAPYMPNAVSGGLPKPAYYQFYGRYADAPQDVIGISENLKIVSEIINETLAPHGITLCGQGSEKVVLMGFSQGGAVALSLATFQRHHDDGEGGDGERFRGRVVAHSTYQPCFEQVVMVHDSPCKILQIHGELDDVLPLDIANTSKNLLRSKGYSVEFIKVPKYKHQIITEKFVSHSIPFILGCC